jgi:hypothetical protein
MKTLLKNNVSVYLFEDGANVLVLDEKTTTPTFVIGDLNNYNCVLFENINTPPSDWVGGKYLYIEGAWVHNVLFVEAPRSEREKEDIFLLEVSKIKAGYSDDEIRSWPDQRAEAEGWKADNNYVTTLIDSIIAETGETKLAFVNNVLEKARLYKIAFGGSLGRKRS